MADKSGSHGGERSLASSSVQLEDIVAAVAIPIYEFDVKATFRYANPHGLHLLGTTEDRLIGKTWQEIGYTPQGDVSFETAIQQVFSTGEPVVAEATRRSSGTVTRSFEFRLNPIREQDGRVKAVAATVIEVTQRRQAEEELLRVAESARCILWIADVFADDDSSLRWDLRVQNEETARQIVPIAIPDGWTFVDAWYMSRPEAVRHEMERRAQEAIWADQDYSQEFPCVLETGRIWLYEKVRVQRISPRQWRAVGFSSDMSELKRFYRGVISAVTNEKLRLRERDEIPDEGAYRLQTTFSCETDLARIRHQVEAIAKEVGMTEDIVGLLLAVGEACTNALVHGVFRRRETVLLEERASVHGSCEVLLTEDRLMVRVTDPGFGIPVFKDPATLLLRGWSTEKSLGMGYTLMLSLVTRYLTIATNESGTCLQLEFWRDAQSHSLDWENTLIGRMAS